MKYVSLVLSALSLIGVVILFTKQPKKAGNPAAVSTVSDAANPMSGRIAFVNIDSLEAKIEYLSTKKKEFKKRQDAMESELQVSAKKLQDDYIAVQQKAQAGTLTRTEGEAAEKRLMQMQESLKTREQALTEQFLKDQEAFNKDLKARLDTFLEEYNKDKGYDYILSYSEGGSILFANKAMDITKDAIEGMNKSYSSENK